MTHQYVMELTLVAEEHPAQREAILLAWEAAAGHAGSPVPTAVVAALREQPWLQVDLGLAALSGTRAAFAQWDATRGDDPFAPRGIDVHYLCGRASEIVWRSETHVIALRHTLAHFSRREQWSMLVYSVRPSPQSPRVVAALQAAYDQANQGEQQREICVLIDQYRRESRDFARAWALLRAQRLEGAAGATARRALGVAYGSHPDAAAVAALTDREVATWAERWVEDYWIDWTAEYEDRSRVASEFVATHEVTTADGQKLAVMQHDDGLYTEGEWEANEACDWHVGEDGSLLFQGRVVDGSSWRSVRDRTPVDRAAKP